MKKKKKIAKRPLHNLFILKKRDCSQSTVLETNQFVLVESKSVVCRGDSRKGSLKQFLHFPKQVIEMWPLNISRILQASKEIHL